MRLHLLISRHGLPVTRILWTVSSSAYGNERTASASAIASSHTPNIALGNGGYTVAQLLEDVNEVVPLETEPGLFDEEYGGQWGLEDYVVEVAGSECLHFMEVEGLLRDGDEVVIRALQLSDLRARRLCGRHQISADGKHLIDGVPFGSPFVKRMTSHRPAITIPPRKKRRISFSGWDQDLSRGNVSSDADREWVPPGETSFGKELSVLPAEHEESDMGTVIRHPIDHTADSESEADDPDFEEEELETELRALREDFDEPSQFIEAGVQGRAISGHKLRSSSVSKRPSSSDTMRRGSLVGLSSLSSKHSRGDDSSPRASKVVRFNKRDGDEDVAGLPQSESAAETSESSETSEPSRSSSDTNDASDASSDEDSDSEEEEGSSDSSPDGSSDSDDSTSAASSELSPAPKKPRQRTFMNPPGHGSVRTWKSNNRYKLRRRLSKLKELGALPPDADFATLRAWEDANGGWYYPSESKNVSGVMDNLQRKEQDQAEFEARRQKLLRDLEAGGVDVDETSEKENVPPRKASAQTTAKIEVDNEKTSEMENPTAEPSSRRSLDIASSRRLLFGSLGMRTPRTKEDEEETRRKLATQASVVQPRKKTLTAEPIEEDQTDSDVDWHDKLDIRATECIFGDIELSTPPFPFQQRWDQDADAIIRQRKGWGKKRKRKQRIQVYNGDEELDDEYDDGREEYFEGDNNLNYDDAEPESKQPLIDIQAANGSLEDLPALPSDLSCVPDLVESDVKVGAVIAFRQLEMSKATNWQPLMSGYRVAEVHDVLHDGGINVRLAKRDRNPKPDINSENDEPRQYSGFEMPGYDDDEEEDDGFREVAFAELSDSKLLRPAARLVDADSVNRNKARTPSVVSVIEDSLPNAQPVPLPVGIGLDEDTGVTLVTEASHHEAHPETLNESASPEQTPEGVRLPAAQTQGQNGDDERSERLAVPPPLFSGFHSPPVEARSSQGASQEPRAGNLSVSGMELSNLDGQTLVAEAQQPALADSSNLEFSALSFMSVNQPGSDVPLENLGSDFQGSDNEPASNLDSLSQASYHSEDVNLASVPDGGSPDEQSSARSTTSWKNFLGTLADSGDEDEEDQEEDVDLAEYQDPDSLLRDEPDLSRTSPSSRASRRPPRIGQDNSQSQQPKPAGLVDSKSPAASTRSRRSLRIGDLPPASQPPNPTQSSEVVDLTLPSPTGSLSRKYGTGDSGPSQRSQESGWVSKPNGDNDTIPRSSGRQTRTSTGKIQRMAEVSISPQSARKKRESRKF